MCMLHVHVHVPFDVATSGGPFLCGCALHSMVSHLRRRRLAADAARDGTAQTRTDPCHGTSPRLSLHSYIWHNEPHKLRRVPPAPLLMKDGRPST